jgi:hypothetical protein
MIGRRNSFKYEENDLLEKVLTMNVKVFRTMLGD